MKHTRTNVYQGVRNVSFQKISNNDDLNSSNVHYSHFSLLSLLFLTTLCFTTSMTFRQKNPAKSGDEHCDRNKLHQNLLTKYFILSFLFGSPFYRDKGKQFYNRACYVIKIFTKTDPYTAPLLSWSTYVFKTGLYSTFVHCTLPPLRTWSAWTCAYQGVTNSQLLLPRQMKVCIPLI